MKEDFTTETQCGCKKSQNISRKGAKAAKFGQGRRYFSLRSWRLGSNNFLTLRPESVWSDVEGRGGEISENPSPLPSP